MAHFDQTQFIKNWNKIAKQCGSFLGKLPLLDKEGVCCGFSFILAEYIRDNKEEDFYKIINIISIQANSLISLIKKSGRTEQEELILNVILDFIYKLHIFDKLQRIDNFSLESSESENEILARNHCASPNHKRINCIFHPKSINDSSLIRSSIPAEIDQ